MGISGEESCPRGQLQPLLEFLGTISEEKISQHSLAFKTSLNLALSWIRDFEEIECVISTEILLLPKKVDENRGLSKAAWVQILALSLSGCVTLGKLLCLSVLQFPLL